MLKLRGATKVPQRKEKEKVGKLEPAREMLQVMSCQRMDARTLAWSGPSSCALLPIPETPKDEYRIDVLTCYDEKHPCSS